MKKIESRSLKVFIVISGFLVFLYLMMTPSRGARALPDERAAPALAAGSTAYLSDMGRPIGVAADRETLSALNAAVMAKDRKAYERLFQNGRAFLVQDRVKLVVLDFEANSAQVRFLDGYHSGKAGWGVREWLKSSP